MIEPIKFFTGKLNITIPQIESLLGAALSKGGEYADLYFEYNVLSNLSLEEQIIKSANRSVRQGVGVRVISGERTGFAYCDEIAEDAIRKAAVTAAHIANSNAQVECGQCRRRPTTRTIFIRWPTSLATSHWNARSNCSTRLIAARAATIARIREVQAGLADEFKVILIATSEGRLIGDVQPLVRMRRDVHCRR